MAIIFCGTNLYYSYSMYIGSFFVTNKTWNSNDDRDYNSGDVISCFLALVYGMAYLGFAIPNF